MQASETKVNLGCGSRYHPDWVNVDMVPQGPGVIRADMSRGLPFPDNSCDVVYNAAVLEHMRRPDAARFLSDCYRILKPGGILRVGVPDLERICHLYLEKLQLALAGDKSAEDDYDWILLELLDQTVREESGGEMVNFLRQQPLPNSSFVFERIGEEGREIVDALARKPAASSIWSFTRFLHQARYGVASLLGASKRRLPAATLGKTDARALGIGRFRLGGEVHQWMYDRFSLRRLLARSGFDDIQIQDAWSSKIPHWTSYSLDSDPEGQVIKPDLFFMEAIKQPST